MHAIAGNILFFFCQGVDSERLFASIPSNIWKEWVFLLYVKILFVCSSLSSEMKEEENFGRFICNSFCLLFFSCSVVYFESSLLFKYQHIRSNFFSTSSCSYLCPQENWFSIESINMESDHVSEKIFLIDDILSVSDAAQEIASMMSKAGHPLRFVDLLISSLHPQSPAKNTDLFISRFSVTSRILAWILSVFSSNQV